MNQENKEIFLMQADKIVREVFDNVSDELFDRIEIREVENPLAAESDDKQASVFYSVIALDSIRQQLIEEKQTAFISEAAAGNETLHFLLLFYNPKKEKLVQKYQIFFDSLKEIIFNFLLDKWKEENFYFYNSAISDILIHNAINDLVTEVSKKCCGYEEIALYENINLSMLNIISDLSYQTYEKANSQGLIYFTSNIQDVDFQFKFDNFDGPFVFSTANIKLLRKLLELTSIKKGLGIISDTNKVYGIGSIKEGISHYSVSFEEDHKWTLTKNSDELLVMKDNSLVFNNARLSSSEFVNYVQEIFPEHKEDNNEKYMAMLGIIKSLIKQQKGSILVVMKDAKKYIERYRDLAILIEPVQLDEKNVEKLSSIDGAIIMDENCICYGFGVVLDGKATGSGNRARGSRYNSSERFYKYCKEENAELFIFVLSDDGNYNFFPSLKD